MIEADSGRPGRNVPGRLLRPRTTLAVWVIAMVVLIVLGLGVQDRLAEPTFLVPGTNSSREFDLHRTQFGSGINYPVLLQGPPREVNAQGQALAAALDREPHVEVLSPWNSKDQRRALQPDPGTVLVVARFDTPASSSTAVRATGMTRRVREIMSEETDPPVRAAVTGQAAIGLGLQEASLEATKRAELLALPVLLLVLLLVFRSVVAAAVPIIIGGVTVGAGAGLLSLVAGVLPVDALAMTFSSMLGLALGIDYSLLIVSRFREELAAGQSPVEAARIASSRAGRTVLLAGALLVAGMVVTLAVLPGGILFSAAVGAVTVTLLSVVTAVVVLPSVLVMLGKNIDRGRLGRGDLQGSPSRALRLVRMSIRSPVVALLVPLVLLLALSYPALSLAGATPSAELLPEDNWARADHETFRRVLGPGWGAPFAMTVVSEKGPITRRPLLDKLAVTQRRIERDRDVALVNGPADLAKSTREIASLSGGLAKLGKTVNRGRGDLARLSTGLARTREGSTRLENGLFEIHAGNAELAEGSAAARRGGSEFAAGLGRARAGAARIADGLREANVGADLLGEGSTDAARGAGRLRQGLERVERETAGSGDEADRLAGDLTQGAESLERLREPVRTGEENLAAAMTGLDGMSVGRTDPQYEPVYRAVATARAALSGRDPRTGQQVDPAYAGLDASLATAADGLRQAAGGVSNAGDEARRLHAGLGALRQGATRLAAGLRPLAAGERRLSDYLGSLAEGTSGLAGGLDSLFAASGELADGSARIEAGAARLSRSAGTAGDGAASLAAGLDRIHTSVADSRRKLPDGGALTRLNKESPGLSRSGYLALAAIEGAPARNVAGVGYVLNVARGGRAARLLVIPKVDVTAPAAERLYERLQRVGDELARDPNLDVAVGGEAAEVLDYQAVTMSALFKLIALLALMNFLLLIVLLRSVLLPLIAVGMNLLTVAATFGALALLFQGSAPLGGPGYIDALALTGTFTVIFALSIDYELFVMARIREGLGDSTDTIGAIEYGVGRSARIIVGAAAIMIAVFLAFAFSNFLTIRQLGVGLSIAIALDATVMRLVLLPALMSLAGRGSWWLPGALDARIPALNLEGRSA